MGFHYIRAIQLVMSYCVLHFPVSGCSQGSPSPGPLNYSPGTDLTIFPDLTIDCDGPVIEWRFYASAPGTFMASIWYSDPWEPGTFRFQGATTITVDQAGEHVSSESFDKILFKRQEQEQSSYTRNRDRKKKVSCKKVLGSQDIY